MPAIYQQTLFVLFSRSFRKKETFSETVDYKSTPTVKFQGEFMTEVSGKILA